MACACFFVDDLSSLAQTYPLLDYQVDNAHIIELSTTISHRISLAWLNMPKLPSLQHKFGDLLFDFTYS